MDVDCYNPRGPVGKRIGRFRDESSRYRGGCNWKLVEWCAHGRPQRRKRGGDDVGVSRRLLLSRSQTPIAVANVAKRVPGMLGK